ncbi:uncharacterized protein [Leptinotarsa decemlineata]|uniref:uncharacterized protein n=1 Tax=Leptinotarsa decemlineata TaxID=7539 RepID=UPI000C2524FE|nr:uncharacterized protein LOC111517723 [Leptinotarsa decemlineata]
MASNSAILCFFICISSMYCLANAYIIIESKNSGLVLDGNEYNVRAMPADGSIGQKWTLTPSDTGRFVITNARNGHALDVQDGCEKGNNLIVYQKHSGTNQLFYINSDGTIGSACNTDLIVEMKDSNGQLGDIQNSCSSGDVIFEIQAAQ